MAVEMTVQTTATFADMEAVEEFLKTSTAFEPEQVIELLDELTLTIEEEDPNELAVRPTKNVFTLKEVK
jgi:hypothetical protein